MSAGDWAVLAGGVAAIAWVNWWFFLAERGDAPDGAPRAAGVDARTERARSER